MNRVRCIREAKGWTQEQLSKACGLPRQHVSDIEREVMRPRIDTAQRIAAALEVTVGDAFPTE